MKTNESHWKKATRMKICVEKNERENKSENPLKTEKNVQNRKEYRRRSAATTNSICNAGVASANYKASRCIEKEIELHSKLPTVPQSS